MSRPPLFTDVDFDTALELAKSSGKLLLVDATASWCGPCQTMDRTTWVAPSVVEALGRRAIAIQLDVDTSTVVTERLRIRAMPTVVAFRDGAEIDRVVGLQRPGELLAWIDGLERGETSLQRARTQASAAPTNVQVRMSFARSLVEAGELGEATTEYVWLWMHMLEHEPTMIGVRHSFLLAELKELVSRHPPARDAFAALRDAAAPPAEGMPSRDALRDWFTLNEVLDDKLATLAWFDVVRTRLDATSPLVPVVELRVVPMLIESGRWNDVAALYPAPRATLAETAQRNARAMEYVPPEHADRLRQHMAESLRETAARLVRALREAGRIDEANAVIEDARGLDDSVEMEAALADGAGVNPRTGP